MCSILNASLLRGIQVPSEGEAHCSINSRIPTKILLRASVTISSVIVESKAVTSLSGMKNRGTAQFLLGETTCSVLLGKVSLSFFLCVYNLLDSCECHCESPMLRAHVVLKRCQPLRWQ